MTSYQPMTLADLGRRLARLDDTRTRWKLVWEFLEEYRWEADDVPAVAATGRTAGHWRRAVGRASGGTRGAPGRPARPGRAGWTEIRVLQRPWFPAELETQRADALVWAPAAFRKHGVYLSARDLEAA